MDDRSRRSIIGDPPLTDKDKVRTKYGRGTIVNSKRTEKGICLYGIEMPGKGIDYFFRHEIQVVL